MIPRDKRLGRYGIITFSALLVSLVAVAGSLTPPGAPASTMRTLQEIYDTVVGPFDSSLITSDPDGSVIQGLKYISENLFWASSSNDIYSINSGNVGIGTATPLTKLDIIGDTLVRSLPPTLGASVSFSHANFSLTEDAIDASTHLTRGTSGPLYNAVTEVSADFDTSPENTEWNTDGFSDIGNLRARVYRPFAPAVSSAFGSVQFVVGEELIMHIISSDTYYKVVFSSWTSGAGGGGFAYSRTQVIFNGGNVYIGTQDVSGTLEIAGTASVSGIALAGTFTSPGTGADSEKFGLNALAGGIGSIAIGNNARVVTGGFGSGENSIVIGTSAIVSNQASVVIGAFASDSMSTIAAENVIIGAEAAMNGGGYYGTIIGKSASGSEEGPTAIGYFAEAVGDSIAIGRNASSRKSTIAIGTGARTTAAGQMVIGDQGDGVDGPINDVYIGRGVTATAPQNVTINSTGGSGTDISGGDLTFAGGKPTGAGGGGNIIFSTAEAGSSGSTLRSLNERMRIDQFGNVGIGTTSPTTKLDIIGNASVSGDFEVGGNITNGTSISGNFDPTIDNTYDLGDTTFRWKSVNVGPGSFNITSTTGTSGSGTNYTLGQIGFSGSSLSFGTFDQGTGNYGSLEFKTASTSRMLISSGGNVGIGTTSVGNAKLSVNPNDGGGSVYIGRNDLGASMIGGSSALVFLPNIGGADSSRLVIGSGTAIMDTRSSSSTAIRVFSWFENTTGSSSFINEFRSSGNISGTEREQSLMRSRFLNTVDATRTSRFQLFVSDFSGQREGLRLETTGTDIFAGIGNSVITGQKLTVGGNIFASSSANTDITLRSLTDDAKFTIRASGAAGIDQLRILNGLGTNLVTIASSGNVGIGTTSPETKIEIIGAASSSQLFGSGLTDCDLESQTLNWDATTGRFSCLADGTGSGGSAVGLREGFTGSFTNFSSVSFNAAHFVLDTGNPDARLSLDWGAGGPASLSQNETVLGQWTFASNTTFSAGASMAGNFDPAVDNTYDLGDTSLRWKSINVGPGSFNITSTTGTSGAGTNYTLGQIGFTGSSLSFGTFDQGTGSYGSLEFKTASTSRMYIAAGGNVGIGTTNPAAKLETRGTTGLITYSGAPYASFTANSQSYIDFGNNVFTFLNDSASRGSALIGIAQDNSMVGTILGVYGDAEATNSILSVNTVVGIEGDAYNSGSGGVESVRGLVTYANQNGSGPVNSLMGIYVAANAHDGAGTLTNNYGIFLDDQTGVADDVNNNYALYSTTGPFVVTASGSVGIGTTTPQGLLSIGGGANNFRVDGAGSVYIRGIVAMDQQGTASVSSQLDWNWFTRDANLDGFNATGDKLWNWSARGNWYSVPSERNDLALSKYTGGGPGTATTMMVFKSTSNFIIPGSDDLISLGSSSFRWKETHSVNFYGTYNAGPDVAERYPASDTVEAGDVVMLDPDPPADKTVSNQSNTQVVNSSGGALAKTGKDVPVAIKKSDGTGVFGVISTAPGVLLSDAWDKTNPPVALVGRVPVKVSKENGTIHTGDRLTASQKIPGYAMKMTDAGQSIGIALSDFPDTALISDKILVFMNVGYWAPSVADVVGDSIEVSSGGGVSDTDTIFSAIIPKFKETLKIVFEKGLIRVAKIITDILETKKLVADELQLKDSQTGEIYCVTIKDGEWNKAEGECGIQAMPTPSPISSSTPAPSSPDSSGSSSMPSTTPVPVDNFEPSPSPSPTIESAPEPSFEPTPIPIQETTIYPETTPPENP